MNKKYDVTVAGHICLDIIPQLSRTDLHNIQQLFIPGKLILVNKATISTGGPVSNTGIALSKLGLTVAFMARIGDDHFGKLIQELLAAQCQSVSLSSSRQGCTSYTIVIAPPGIDRMFLHHPGANDEFAGDDLNIETIRQSRIFHFGYPPIMAQCYQNDGEELRRIFQIAKTAGAITSLDLALPDPTSPSGNAPWRLILKKVLPYVNIFIPSIEEIFFMLEPDHYFAVKAIAGANDIIDFIEPEWYFRLAEQCLNFGSNIVVFKTAHRGYYILTADFVADENFTKIFPGQVANWIDRELWCPAYRVPEIASATGSGDSSIAGFLAAFIRGFSIEKTLKFANCLGYQNLHGFDAISGIQSWDATVELIENDRLEMIPVPLENSSWKWYDQSQLWLGAGDKYDI